MKYKVRYNEGGKVNEKEVEAAGFNINKNGGGKSVTFHGFSRGSREELHAFSDFISIERIEEGYDQ
jgi:hypothetical protein